MTSTLRPLTRAAALALACGIAATAGAVQVSAAPRLVATTVERQPLTGAADRRHVVTLHAPPRDGRQDRQRRAPSRSPASTRPTSCSRRSSKAGRPASPRSSTRWSPTRSGRSARAGRQDINMLGNLNDPIFVWSGGNSGVTARAAADRHGRCSARARRDFSVTARYHGGAAQPVRQHVRAVGAAPETPATRCRSSSTPSPATERRRHAGVDHRVLDRARRRQLGRGTPSRACSCARSAAMPTRPRRAGQHEQRGRDADRLRHQPVRRRPRP